MYEHADAVLKRILALAESCPEAYRGKAFEILLQAYVTSLGARPASAALDPMKVAADPGTKGGAAESLDTSIPPEVQARLKAMAKRIGVTPEALATLFDFSSDPFTFAPVNVGGAGASERSKKVALLVAARSFLATSKWQGDWSEIKAMCVHQNCYDVANFSAVLKKAKGGIFKTVEPGASVSLSSTGTTEAEQLLAAICKQATASEQ